MTYSIKPILHDYKDADGLQKIIFQIIIDKKKSYPKTPFKVYAHQFSNGQVVNHALANEYNLAIAEQKIELEKKIIDTLRSNEPFALRKSESLLAYLEKLIPQIQTKLKPNRIKKYNVLKNKIISFDKDVRLTHINKQWLQSFEANELKTCAQNTVHTTMKVLKAVLNHAENEDIIQHKQWAGYKNVSYSNPMPVFLEDKEVAKFRSITETLPPGITKYSGYLFLLSCYAGYRLQDAIDFNKEKILRNAIVLRAGKNGKIVSMPIYTELKPVVDYIIAHKMKLDPATVRNHVKRIAALAGIKKEIKFHTSRHSFAMRMSEKGFDLDEIAELIGDSADVTKIYRRILNERLAKKIKRIMK